MMPGRVQRIARTWLLLAAALLLANAATAQILLIDGARLNATLSELKTYGGKDNGGSRRVAYSQENRDALQYLGTLMRAAGLDTSIDVAGNLIGRRRGSDSGAAPLIAGSHIDTVPDGGHYDGILGAMAAIEVARTLNDARVALRHPLEIIVWSNEEGGKTGSRSFNGSVDQNEMQLPSLGTRSLGDGMRFLGGDPDRIAENVRQPGDIAGYIELHIEQGAVLDREGVDIGVVEGIVGIKRWNVTVEGFANHAGTTPMDQRRDAMFVAARVIVAIEDAIRSEPGPARWHSGTHHDLARRAERGSRGGSLQPGTA